MIQFNLLPDVKIEYIKTQRTKHLAMSISIIATAVAVGILIIFLLIVDVWQKKSLSDLNGDIKKYSSQIKNTPNVNQILTVQNQLQSLPALDAQKPQTTKLFNYITQLTPNKAGISMLTLDLTTNTLTISGTANNLVTVDKFVDTFKFTTYKTSNNSNSKNAFSNVVLASFGTSPQGASYEITLTFDPIIFNSTDNATLNVPDIISTRSETDKPQSLFVAPPKNNGN